MDRARLLTELAGTSVGPEDLVFVERRGDDYRWRRPDRCRWPLDQPYPLRH